MTDTHHTTDVFGLLMSPAVRTDPYPTYARLLATQPVIDTGLGVHFVFSHHDCLTLLRDRRVSVDERRSNLEIPAGEPLPTLFHLDPPDHTRLRALVATAFTPRRVEALRVRAVELVEAALDRLGPGDEVDLVAELAYPVPLTIICDLLGIPAGDRADVQGWSTWMARSIDPGLLRSPELNAHIDEAERGFTTYVRALLADRRRAPGDDLLSALVATEGAGGDALTEDELVGLAVLLLVAGHETTVSLVANGVLSLLRHPDQWAAVRAGLVPDKRIVDELVRFDSPVQMTSRVALEDLHLPAGTIPRGDFAVLMIGSANRDPAVFDAPHRLDVAAERATGNLAFGFGIHHCIGVALARAEAEAVIPALVRRFPATELLDEPPLRPTFVLRGREELRLRLG